MANYINIMEVTASILTYSVFDSAGPKAYSTDLKDITVKAFDFMSR